LLYQDQQRQQQAAARIQALTENFKTYAQAVQGLGTIPPALQKAIDQNAQLLQASGASPEEVQAMQQQVQAFAELPGEQTQPDYQNVLLPDGTTTQVNVNDQQAMSQLPPGSQLAGAASVENVLPPDVEAQKTRMAIAARPPGTVVNINNKPVSEAEKAALGYGERLSIAEDTLSNFESNGYVASGPEQALGSIPGIGNYLTSDTKKAYDQAKGDWIAAHLRKESQASISDTEFERDDKLYFPQPNDPPEVIAQKRAARQKIQGNISREGRPVTGEEASSAAAASSEADAAGNLLTKDPADWTDADRKRARELLGQ
jgi:hypothetical protein